MRRYRGERSHGAPRLALGAPSSPVPWQALLGPAGRPARAAPGGAAPARARRVDGRGGVVGDGLRRQAPARAAPARAQQVAGVAPGRAAPARARVVDLAGGRVDVGVGLEALVGEPAAVAEEAAGGVDQAELVDRVGQRAVGVAQQRLGAVRRHRRVELEADRGGAGDHRGGHRGAAGADVLAAVADAVGAQLGVLRVRREVGDDLGARRVDVGLREAVLRRAAARPAGRLVVGDLLRALVVDRADRDHVGVVAGRVADGVAARAAVAGGGDHEDALEPGRLDRGVERVGLVGLGRRATRATG